MKTGWSLAPLGEVATFNRGLTYSKKDEVEISESVVLRATNISSLTNQLDLSELRYISDNVAIPVDKKVQRNSLLICTASGSKSHLGKVAYIDRDYNYAFGGFMGMITPKNMLLPKFLFYQLTSHKYKQFIQNLADGTNINNLKFDDLGKFGILIAPLAEQQRIIDALDRAFAAIGLAEKSTNKKLKYTKALYDEYFQNIFVGDSSLPMERLEQICTFTSGGTPAKDRQDYWGGSIPWVSGRDMKSIQIFDTHLHISQSALDQSAARLAPAGTLLILVRGMGLAHGAQVAELMVPSAFNQDIKAIHIKSKILPRFLLFAIKTQINSSHKVLSNAAHGTLKIDMDKLKQLIVPVPALNKQGSIISDIDKMEDRVQQLTSECRRKLALLNELKKAILAEAII